MVFEKSRPAPGREQRFPVPGSDVTLVAEEYEPHVEVAESFEPRPRANPALHFILQAPFATPGRWLVARRPAAQPPGLRAGLPRLPRRRDRRARRRSSLGHPEGANHLSFVAAPGRHAPLRGGRASGAAHDGRRRGGQAGRRPAGRGWASPSTASCERRALGARSKPATPPAKEERRQRRGAGPPREARRATASEWLLWTERGASPSAAAGDPRLPLARGGGALQGDAAQVQLRQVPGLEHGRDLRELGARRRPREAAPPSTTSR